MKRKRNKISPEGRRRQAEAGARNLQKWKATHGNTELAPELKTKLDSLRAGLSADLGGQLTAAEACLVDSACTSYGIVLLAFRQLSLAPGRIAKKKGLSGAIAAHQNSLLRALKVLGIRNRRPPSGESLEDIIRQYDKPAQKETEQ